MLLFTALQRGMISTGIYNAMEDPCECGWMLKTNHKLTDLNCTNPFCPIHMSYKMKKALDIFGLTINIGETRCGEIIVQNGISHHMDIFNLTMDQFPKRNSYTVRKDWCDKINEAKKDVKLDKIMTAMQFEDLSRQRCGDIFSRYSTIADFYNDNNSIYDLRLNLAEILKINQNTATIDSLVDTLWYNKQVIEKVCNYFEIRKVSKNQLVVAMTGEITKVKDDDGNLFKPREAFIEYLNNRYDVEIIIKKFSGKCECLIADYPTDSSQYEKASRVSKVISSDVFMQFMEDNYKRRGQDEHN